MANLYPPPAIASLPVSLSADIIVTFRNQTPESDPPEYEDYPDGATLSLVIGKVGATVAEAEATIEGSNAVCRIPFTVADTLKNGLPWRCVVGLPDPDGTDTDSFVAINGPVVRSDGI